MKSLDANRACGKQVLFGLALVCAAALSMSACSIKRTAVKLVGNAVAGGGQAYSTDNDPEFVREALPFAIKASEGLLRESPDHQGLLLAVAQGYTLYAYLLQDEADYTEAADFLKAKVLRDRARGFYLRSRDYALKGLGIEAHSVGLLRQTADRVSLATQQDVPFLYWAAVSWAGALSAAKDDLKLISALPLSGMMARRILQLNEGYEWGAAHEFLIFYEGSRPGGSAAAARHHYRQALNWSKGRRASTYLALAESVVIREQNAREFRSLMKAALAIDPDQDPELRLANTIARKRAEWLLSRLTDLFLDTGGETEDAP